MLYGLLAIWLTWPLAARAGTALAGSSTDALLHYWNSWWVRQALSSGQSILYTRQLFYPEGASLLTHNIAWLNAIIWLPLQVILKDLVAYNIVFLMNLVLGGYITFLLASRLVDNKLAAFLAGLIYMAWPYRLSQLDHPNLVSTQWIPLLLLFLIVAIREGRWRYGIAAGVSIALIGYTRWQLLIPAGILVASFLLVTQREWLTDRRRWLTLLLAGAIAALLLAPPAWLLIRQQINTPDSAETLLRDSEEAVMQSDLLAFLTPAPDHPLFGSRTHPAYDQYYGDRSESRRFPVYLGLVTLLLAAIGLWRRPRAGLPWLVMFLVVFLLSLGPILRVNGRLFPGIPTPYNLLEPLFILRLLREPERFNIVLALPVAILAGFGVAAVLETLQKNSEKAARWQPVLAVALGLLILFDYAGGPIPLQDATAQPFFEQLAGESGDFAVLTLPIDPVQSKVQMFDQTVHGRPLLHGHISRPPQGAYEFIDEDPWLRVIRQSGEMPPWLSDVGAQLDSLAWEKIRYIIFYKNQVGADRIARWQRYLGLAPAYEDDALAVFRTQPEAGRDFELLTELRPGLGPVQTLASADCLQPGQPLEVDVMWGTAAGLEGPFQARLALVDEGGNEVQHELYPLDPESPEISRPANALFWAYYPMELDPGVAPGKYDLVLSVVDGAGVAPPDGVTRVTALTISDETCPSGLPETAIVTDALFGDEMRLLGYEVERPSAGQIAVTLYWRGEQRMAADYKVFVHIFDPATGVPVAQDDSMPHRGGFPTRFWAAGELVSDRIPIDIGGAPAGEYGLALGVYDPLTMERRLLSLGDGRQPEDRRLVTGETIIVENP